MEAAAGAAALALKRVRAGRTFHGPPRPWRAPVLDGFRALSQGCPSRVGRMGAWVREPLFCVGIQAPLSCPLEKLSPLGHAFVANFVPNQKNPSMHPSPAKFPTTFWTKKWRLSPGGGLSSSPAR